METGQCSDCAILILLHFGSWPARGPTTILSISRNPRISLLVDFSLPCAFIIGILLVDGIFYVCGTARWI
jgi:hypothetical protein